MSVRNFQSDVYIFLPGLLTKFNEIYIQSTGDEDSPKEMLTHYVDGSTIAKIDVHSTFQNHVKL